MAVPARIHLAVPSRIRLAVPGEDPFGRPGEDPLPRPATGREQEGLAGRMGPGRRSGSVQNAGDVVGGIDNLEDAHAAAELAADGDVDGEHVGEELGPGEATRPWRGLGVVGRLEIGGAREAEGELLPGHRGRGWNDARSEVVAICEQRKALDLAPCSEDEFISLGLKVSNGRVVLETVDGKAASGSEQHRCVRDVVARLRFSSGELGGVVGVPLPLD